MFKQLAAWLIVAAAALGIAGGLGFYKYSQFAAATAAAGNYPEPSESVAAVRAMRGEWSAKAQTIGTVVALRQLEVRNEIAGAIAGIGFSSGETVEAGQLLVQLDDRQEKASLAAAEAEARLAKLNLERRENLSGSPAFSQQELDKAREEFAAASARAQSLAVAIEKKRIAAPFRARIGITDLQPGAYLDAGTRIAVLQGVDDNAFVDFSLPQDSAAMLRTGVAVTISAPGLPGGEAEAVIAAESESVDSQSRTVRFRAVANGHGESLRPGMFVNVTARISELQPVVLAPLTSVRRSAHGEHVYVLVNEDGKLRARQRIVKTGPVQNGSVVILEGLQAGETIASSGSFKLREGLLVRSDFPPITTGALVSN